MREIPELYSLNFSDKLKMIDGKARITSKRVHADSRSHWTLITISPALIEAKPASRLSGKQRDRSQRKGQL
jgi:hypothetical protein